jgi:hypothetical protein
MMAAIKEVVSIPVDSPAKLIGEVMGSSIKE